MVTRRAGLAFPIAAVVLAALAYANSIDNPFHFDDGHSIQDNVWIRDLKNIPKFFTDVSTFSPLRENLSYRPLLLVGYSIAYNLGRPHGVTRPFHGMSLLFHILGAMVLGFLARRLLRASGHGDERAFWGGLSVTAIFAVHPLLSEPVNYVSAGSSLISSVLMFATVLAYVKAREENKGAGLVLTNVLLLLALGVKLIAVTVPVLLVVWELTLGPARDRLFAEPRVDWAKRLVPPFAIATLFTAVHERMIGPYVQGARSNIKPYSHLLTQTRVWQRYQGLLLWPEDLCADLTMRWSEHAWEGETARAILWTLALLALGAWLWKRIPMATLGIAWFYLTLAPTNSIVPLSEPATEHRVYVAVPGLLFLLVGLVMKALEDRTEAPSLRAPAIGLGMLVIVGALTWRTHQRNKVWVSDESLWADVITRSPDNGRAHLNYGLALMRRGELAGARTEFDRCAKEWPGYSFCWINLAVLNVREKRISEADEAITRAEGLQPGNVYVNQWRGEVELERERWPEAEAAFQRTLGIAPGYVDARRGLAVALFEQGKLEQAEPMLAQLEREGALDARSWFAIGFLRYQKRDADGAIAAYEAALRFDPGHARARYNLAVAYHAANKLAEAISHYEILARQPNVKPEVLFNLAYALWQSGSLERARVIKEQLRARDPSFEGLARLEF